MPFEQIQMGTANTGSLHQALQRQRQLIQDEKVEEGNRFRLHLLPGAQRFLPKEFLQDPLSFALESGAKTIKEEPLNEEIIWKLPGEEKAFVMKRIQTGKKGIEEGDMDKELRVLQLAELLGLPAPKPLGIILFDNDLPFLLMEYVSGLSGVDLYQQFLDMGDTEEDAKRKISVVCKKLEELAARFRTEMQIDKKWYIKDCLITLDEHGEVSSVFPIDWERAHPYDPRKPERIDTLEIALRRRSEPS